MTKRISGKSIIQGAAVYTPNEVQDLLKISSSTFKRLVKKPRRQYLWVNSGTGNSPSCRSLKSFMGKSA